MLCLFVTAHHLLASLETTSIAKLEEPSAARKIGLLAAQAAARGEQNNTTGLTEIQNAENTYLPGPAAAGLAMRYSGTPALLARFHQIQKETASALNRASSEGRILSTLATPLPAVLTARDGGRELTR